MEESVVLETTKKVFKNCGGAAVSSHGTSGGISTLWDEQIWKLEVTQPLNIGFSQFLKIKNPTILFQSSISICLISMLIK
jgi:hypothetical protein